ncbi:MAG: alkaline phosphatase family protein [Candidatus Helarchaeota archaeon]|nr:alkaline phosphatase family protein [Candidatus Helarchaeota archaeon]
MRLFLFILDGCPTTELKVANTPFFDELSEGGKITLECEAVFPTATYTGHSSIITGTYPDQHGMVGNQFWDRQNKCIRNFDYFDPNENIMAPTLFELLPFPTCSICEPVSKGASVIVKKKIFDEMPLEKQNQSIFNHLESSLAPDIRFYMVNFQGVDGFGERMGPKSSNYLEVLEECDKLISKVKDKVKSEFIFIISADHGMTTVHTNINLEKELGDGGFKVKCLASHRTCHVYSDDLGEVEKYLRTLPFVDKVLNSAEIKRAHLTHERTGDLVVCAKTGFEFGDEILNGSHGGATQAELKVPLIIFDSENRVIEDISIHSPRLIDICPTILEIFQIKPMVQFQGKSLYKKY